MSPREVSIIKILLIILKSMQLFNDSIGDEELNFLYIGGEGNHEDMEEKVIGDAGDGIMIMNMNNDARLDRIFNGIDNEEFHLRLL